MTTFQTLLAINFLTVLALIAGLVTNLFIAQFFGLSQLLDAYFAALMLPQLFMALFVDYLGKNFLPEFSRAKREGDPVAAELASTVVNLAGMVALLVVLLLTLFSTALFKLVLPGFEAAQVGKASTMFWIMSPVVLLMAINTFHEYIWQYRESYLRVMFAKMLPPVVGLLVLVLGGARLGEYALAAGLTLGVLMQSLALSFGIGYGYRPVLAIGSRHVRRVLTNSGILVGSGLLARIRPVIERYYASLLGAGSISALALANKLCMPLHQSSSFGLRMVSFSKSGKLHADGKMPEMGRLYTRTMVAVFIYLVPLTVWMMIFSNELVHILFGRGKFDAHMEVSVASALLFMSPAIVFMGVSQVISNAFYVMGKVKLLAILGPVSTVIYWLVILASYERLGLSGIALATSVIHLISFFVMTVVLARDLAAFSLKSIYGKLILYHVCSLAAFGGLAYLLQGVSGHELIYLAASFVFGCAIYAAMLWLIKDEGMLYLWRKIRERKRYRGSME